MAPTLVFGAGGIGDTEKSFTYTWTTPDQVSNLLDTLESLSVVELDSAASYPPGNPWNTETLLGQARVVDRGFVVDSKVEAHSGNILNEETIVRSVRKTLALLGASSIRTLYAHKPDPGTPVEETVRGFVRVVEAGFVENYGICNYSFEQLTELLDCCEKKGYLKPAVYQDMYNPLYRLLEKEVMPLLQKHGIKFMAYSPLAGGFLTGKVTFSSEKPDALHRTRWAGESTFGPYSNLYDNQAMHDVIRGLHKSCEAEGLTITEASLRWLVHHSTLRDGDGVILGASKIEQVVGNVEMCRKGPLSDALAAEIDALWGRVEGETGPLWH